MIQVAHQPELTIMDEATLCARASDLPLDRVRQLERFARDRQEALLPVLIERAGVDESDLLRKLAGLLDIPFLDTVPDRIEPAVLQQIPASLAIQRQVVPLEQRDDGVLCIACSNPFEWRQWDELEQLTGRPLDKVLCTRSIIEQLLKNW